MDVASNLTVVYMGQSLTLGRVMIACLYTCVLLVGLTANICVAKILANLIFRNCVQNVPRSVQLFIFVLCLSDIVILVSFGLMPVDMFAGQWLFGPAVCQWHVSVDMFNKFFGPFMLAALSVASYTSICTRIPNQADTQFSYAKLTVAVCFASSLVLTLPSFYYTALFTLPLPKTQHSNNERFNLVVLRCGFNPNPLMRYVFTGYGTIMGYLVPMLVFCYFYAKIGFFVRRHNRRAAARAVPLRVGKMICALVLVYLCCWTPFWLGAWVSMFFQLAQWQVKALYVTHLLPYISCTIYPIIYTYMNRGIKEAHARLSEQQRLRKISKSEFSTRSNHSFNSMRSSIASTFNRSRQSQDYSTVTAKRSTAASLSADHSRRSSRNSNLSLSRNNSFRARSAEVSNETPFTKCKIVRHSSLPVDDNQHQMGLNMPKDPFLRVPFLPMSMSDPTDNQTYFL